LHLLVWEIWGRVSHSAFSGVDWNRTLSKTASLVENGARAASSVKEAVACADVVMTSLMDDQSILDMVQAAEGLLAGMKPGAVHVCVTTISPTCADQLAELHKKHGSYYVSGTVVGRPDAAASGQLISYLAGDPSAIAIATPVCSAYSKQVVAIPGKASIANSLKLCINYNIISIIELIGETYVMAEKCGVPLEYLRDFYQQDAFAHPGLKMYAEKLRSRDFEGRGGFVMKGGLKDVNLMLSTAKNAGAELEIGKILERKLQAGIAGGMAETDWSAIYEISRREAGLA
jgi:3-hydroxyisobutyrate dehydrogenase-like beta-hydroxyacid dehydrogenase